MAHTARLQLRIPITSAREAVGATLSDQGFAVRRRGDALDVERTAVAGGPSTSEPVRFQARFSEGAEGTVVEFVVAASADPGAARVVLAAARVAGNRLAERGLRGAAQGSSEDEPAVGGDAPSIPEGADAESPPALEPLTAAPKGAVPVDAEPAATPSPSDAVVTAPTPAPERVGSAAATSAQPAAAGAATSAQAAPVSTWAILALILGFVAPVGGIVAGGIALVRVRRADERGRGIAIAGIVVGSLMTVLLAAAAIAGAGLFLASTGPHADPSSGIANTPTPTAAAPPDPSPSAGVFVPAVGQCFTRRGGGEIGEANTVPCADPHAYEVYARFTIDGDEYPGDAAVAERAQQGCIDAFTAFVGRLYGESVLDDVYLSPTPKTWARGDRSVTCLVTDPAATTTGSLSGAAR